MATHAINGTNMVTPENPITLTQLLLKNGVKAHQKHVEPLKGYVTVLKLADITFTLPSSQS